MIPNIRIATAARDTGLQQFRYLLEELEEGANVGGTAAPPAPSPGTASGGDVAAATDPPDEQP